MFSAGSGRSAHGHMRDGWGIESAAQRVLQEGIHAVQRAAPLAARDDQRIANRADDEALLAQVFRGEVDAQFPKIGHIADDDLLSGRFAGEHGEARAGDLVEELRQFARGKRHRFGAIAATPDRVLGFTEAGEPVHRRHLASYDFQTFPIPMIRPRR